MVQSAPVDVDVTFGYADGTLRTYTVRNFVIAEGTQVLRTKLHQENGPGSTTVTMPVTGSPIDPLALFLYVGIALLAYHVWGPWGLIGASIFGMWCRRVMHTAKQTHLQKVMNARTQSVSRSSDQRSDS